MLSGRTKKEYAKEVQAAAEDPDGAPAANDAAAESDLETVQCSGDNLSEAQG